MAGIDRAIEYLMPYTRFRNIGRKVYLLTVLGNLPTEQQDKLRELSLLE